PFDTKIRWVNGIGVEEAAAMVSSTEHCETDYTVRSRRQRLERGSHAGLGNDSSAGPTLVSATARARVLAPVPARVSAPARPTTPTDPTRSSSRGPLLRNLRR